MEDIAEQRGLSTGTIAGHLIKLRNEFPKEDLEYYRPDDKLLKKVTKARKGLKGDTSSLKPLHAALNGSVDYDDIKLALAFLEK